MKIPDFDPGFVAVIIGGAIIKVFTSKRLTLWSGMLTAFIAIFCAAVFTSPVANYLGIEDTNLRYAVAALLTLSGEAFVRFFIDLDKENIASIFKAWRGK